ncbi:MAG: hypothetical protein IPM81_16580 [Saprospirales bacterium]|nr:hypothetical protein [Saprospirales bacterium]
MGGTWQEMTFDMSAAASFTTITKILIVFNPFKLDDSDTYYFDNICATPNYCVGSAPIREMLDNLIACNATYPVGWDSCM